MKLVFDFPDNRIAGPSKRRVFERPVREIVADRLDEVMPAITAVHAAAEDGLYAAGYVSYEAAPAFERAMRVHPGSELPLVRFGVFEQAVLEAAAVRHSRLAPTERPTWMPQVGRDEYRSAIDEIREAIARGDVYQVNHTFRLHATVEPDYEVLRAAQRAGFTADLNFGDTRIVSLSPELFFARRGSTITTRPMKGTRRRGRWTEEDRELARELAASPKDRAENLMIVDLMRNDLGRVACTGTVRVPSMFEIERYPTVWQMTSTITAELREEVTLVDLFAALFPSGSVTGAPKIAATRMIARLERSPREVYCGAIGIVEPGGDCTFNVPIRTLRIDRSTGAAVFGTGSGITWDSDAEAEYDESLAKADLLNRTWPAFDLLETMRADDGRVARIERHIARMRDSAEYFDFAFDEHAVRQALVEAAGQHHGARRLRLRLAADGRTTIESSRDEPPNTPVPVAFATRPIDSTDPFLHHKTTARVVYDDRLAERPHAWDVLLVNEHGRVTEFTRGNVVIERDGSRFTPPREDGLLAGTFRAELLESGEVVEQPIGPEDIRQAERVWLANSVCGLLPVRLVD